MVICKQDSLFFCIQGEKYMIKRLVFDVDGTLISQCDYVSVVTRVLTKIGKYSDENAEKLLFGVMTYENHFNFYDKNLFIKYLSVVMGIKLNKLKY